MTIGALLGQGFTAEPARKPAAFWRARAAAVLFVALAYADAPAASAASDEPRARMLALVNAERAQAGLGLLALEPRLTAAACRHGRDLARGGPLSHRGSDGSDLADRVMAAGYPFALVAENLAAGVPTPDETVWLWSGSPGHRRNMLTPEIQDAGIAHLTGAGGAIWVLVLGRARPDGRPPDAGRTMVDRC